MGITLVQSDKSMVSPTDDARLYQLLASGAEGLVQGCEISHKGGRVLHINSGWGIAQGRCFVITDQDFTVSGASSGTENGRLFVRLQPSQSPPVILQTLRSSGSLGKPVQQPINYGGQTYEIELCTYRISAFALSDLRVTVPRVSNPGGAVYTATFRLGGWSSGSGQWTQTVACAGMRAAYNTGPPWITLTGNKGTDAELRDALNALNAGYLETLDGQIRATVYSAPPTADVQIYMQRVNLPAG